MNTHLLMEKESPCREEHSPVDFSDVLERFHRASAERFSLNHHCLLGQESPVRHCRDIVHRVLSGFSRLRKIAILVALSFSIAFSAPLAAMAQGSYPIGGNIPTAPVTAHPVVGPSAPMFAPQLVAGPGFVSPNLVPAGNPLIVFPKDVSNVLLPGFIEDQPTMLAIGVQELDPGQLNLSYQGTEEGLLVRADPAADYQAAEAGFYRLDSGSLYVSLRAPAKYVTVTTANGLVQLKSEGDAFASFDAGVFRIANVTARGTCCKVLVDTGSEKRLLALAPGYELVIGDRALRPAEIRAADGIARRRYHVFTGQQVAVNEFSVRSMLTSSSIVEAMLHDTSQPERKAINDMCKMAEVLDYIHGGGGYKVAPATGVAIKPFSSTR